MTAPRGVDETWERDQVPSAFASILKRLVEATPGAIGAALADEEGESVDYFGDRDPEDLKLAAAYMGIMLNRASKSRATDLSGEILELRVCGQWSQIVGRPMGMGYQVTVLLERTATLPKLHLALEQALAELRLEAGGALD